ncbi:MAG TPA: hypothetical protein PLG43_10360, partial [Spirochaetia bacterium]|nr:hypothetical protein [Spirochaetia bacterium]
RRIPNLRKISVSPWNNYKKILPDIGKEYVASIKPTPAIFAGEGWDPRVAEENLKEALAASEGVTPIEFIMKDISTVRYKPQRLWNWADIAMHVVGG